MQSAKRIANVDERCLIQVAILAKSVEGLKAQNQNLKADVLAMERHQNLLPTIVKNGAQFRKVLDQRNVM